MKAFWKLKGDKVIWIIVVLFAMISIAAVFSSSSFLASSRGISKVAIFMEQTKSVLMGFVALLICYLIPLRFYRTFSLVIFGASVLMLLMLFVPGLRAEINGAVRGIKIGGHTFQVFEFAKIGVILYLAKALEMWGDQLDDFKQFALKILLPIGAVCLLIMQNSFSSALLIAIISFLILFFLDVSWKNLGITIGIVAAAVLLLFLTYHAFFAGRPERQQSTVGKIFNRFGTVESRLTAHFDKEEEEESLDGLSRTEIQQRKDKDRQSENAKVAISEGGIFGKGPGKSTQRYSLSMAFSDFIYAFIVEEYGLLGGAVVILLYLIFLFRCIRLCQRCKATYSSVLIVGLSFLIATQAFLHILVNVRLFPITGHTLPLISHGGTAYLVLCGAFGMILSVNRQLDKQDARERAEREAAAAQLTEEYNPDTTSTTDHTEITYTTHE
ncbi:MAG: FtsW/RodA/SpoVE family cell cycle protein [Bacteroidales bacterium]|jgi:cell division protein FtsW|nr:FtsW/RodA/SpoVE family cell cycle protein [Bacteroidales bacterium]